MKLNSSYVDSVIATSKDIKDRDSELIVLVDVLAKMAKMVRYVDNLDAFYKDMQDAENRYVDAVSTLFSAYRYVQADQSRADQSKYTVYNNYNSDEDELEPTIDVFLNNNNVVRFMADNGFDIARLGGVYSMFLDYGHYVYDSDKLRTDMDTVLDRICYIRCECPEAKHVPMSTTERLISILPTVNEYLGES